MEKFMLFHRFAPILPTHVYVVYNFCVVKFFIICNFKVGVVVGLGMMIHAGMVLRSVTHELIKYTTLNIASMIEFVFQ